LHIANGAHARRPCFGVALAGLFVDRNLPAARRALAGFALGVAGLLPFFP
jgi:hypothetical protein